MLGWDAEVSNISKGILTSFAAGEDSVQFGSRSILLWVLWSCLLWRESGLLWGEGDRGVEVRVIELRLSLLLM